LWGCRKKNVGVQEKEAKRKRRKKKVGFVKRNDKTNKKNY